MKRARLPIPQYEFAFVAGIFNLMLENTDDGERIARELAEAEQARRMAETRQSALLKRRSKTKRKSLHRQP